MYEKPSLQLVGPASKVVLGIVSFGDDIDGFCVPVELAFADDPREHEGHPSF